MLVLVPVRFRCLGALCACALVCLRVCVLVWLRADAHE